MTDLEARRLVSKIVFHKNTNSTNVYKLKDDFYIFSYTVTGFLNEKYFSISIFHYSRNKESSIKVSENVTEEIEIFKKTFKIK